MAELTVRLPTAERERLSAKAVASFLEAPWACSFAPHFHAGMLYLVLALSAIAFLAVRYSLRHGFWIPIGRG
jgi:hypothetical protein